MSVGRRRVPGRNRGARFGTAKGGTITPPTPPVGDFIVDDADTGEDILDDAASGEEIEDAQ